MGNQEPDGAACGVSGYWEIQHLIGPVVPALNRLPQRTDRVRSRVADRDRVLTAAETTAYMSEFVAAYPSVREVWLYGSRANGSAGPGSDWDYLVFADHATYMALEGDLRFKRVGIDLMIVTDGCQFAKPWADQKGRKVGTLAKEFGGLCWERHSATEATYRATKAPEANGWSVRVFTQRAVRVFPMQT